MAIVGLILVGAIIGALGRLIVPGKQHLAWWMHLLIGVAAVLLTGLLLHAVGIENWVVSYVVGGLIAAGIIMLTGAGGRDRSLSR
jgi:uncharacterized membrane protein YeaQ/YmgE (transglycosylase-associated protein family)